MQPAIQLSGAGISWPRLWRIVHRHLSKQGYAHGTLLLYRCVLRRLADFAYVGPGRINANTVRAYIYSLRPRDCSWSWLGSNISVLRNVFDKLGGMKVARTLKTPKRPYHLPTVLNHCEAVALLRAGATVRDRLLMALMYLCGMRPGEVCALKWGDIDTSRHLIRIRSTPVRLERWVGMPEELRALLEQGRSVCDLADFLFPGRHEGKALSLRAVQMVVARAVKKAAIIKPVSCMTLRHSFAVTALERGMTIRQVQEILGHRRIETTMVYEDCMLPKDAVSPLESLCKKTQEQSLFSAPLDLAYQLPFAREDELSLRERAGLFCGMLSTRSSGRLLASRAPG